MEKKFTDRLKVAISRSLDEYSNTISTKEEEIEIYIDGILSAISSNKATVMVRSYSSNTEVIIFAIENFDKFHEAEISTFGFLVESRIHIDVIDSDKIVARIAKYILVKKNMLKPIACKIDALAVAIKGVAIGDYAQDNLNELVVDLPLDIRQVNLIRTYAHYLQHYGICKLEHSIPAILNNVSVIQTMIRLFDTRFNPSFLKGGGGQDRPLLDNIEDFITRINSKDEVICIQNIFAAINATVRTNFYCNNGEKSYISIKIDSSLIPKVPKPIPFKEIFVYDAKFSAIHLRGGKIARGGLRWSDRKDSLRAEVAALEKTQVIKNAQIVPTGAKGGFYTHNNSLGVQSYKNFLSAMLDITDNIIDGRIIEAKDVVALDETDTYLVVAADKGTATFSDYANQISEQYNFWMRDAFASGGSNGYDHKALGITARGAWESVKRHFRENGIDIAKDTITTIGIGSMNGDVFGNGLIYSENIKLLAAFSNLHIFIDPTPDPKTSFTERNKLFNSKDGSWTGYNPDIISNGGGVFSRLSKEIVLSQEMIKMFAIPSGIQTITPNELIKKILALKVDLMWSGGVGTYVKSEKEIDTDVKDASNDSIRINAKDVSARFIGEGANLSFTQLARVEYSKNGGYCYTDAIDNAGGVNCSDYEVNIKIALSAAIEANAITKEESKKIIKKMEQDVVSSVLKNNHLQTQSISAMFHMDVRDSVMHLNQLIHHLEKIGMLDRNVESLPSDNEIKERLLKRQGFVRPEICVLLAYGKMYTKSLILENITNIVKLDEAMLYLTSYFPPLMTKEKKVSESTVTHTLKKEIIATCLSNEICNYCGPTFLSDIISITDASVVDIIKSYLIVKRVGNIAKTWDTISSLDNVLIPQWQYKQLSRLTNVIRLSIYTILAAYGTKFDFEVVMTDIGSVSEWLKNKNMMETIFKTEIEKDKNNTYNNNISDDLLDSIAATMLLHRLILFTIAAKGEVNTNKVKKLIEQYAEAARRCNIPDLRSLLYGKNFRSYEDMKKCISLFSKTCNKEINFYRNISKGKIKSKSLEPEDIFNKYKEGDNMEGSMLMLLKTIESFGTY